MKKINFQALLKPLFFSGEWTVLSKDKKKSVLNNFIYKGFEPLVPCTYIILHVIYENPFNTVRIQLLDTHTLGPNQNGW